MPNLTHERVKMKECKYCLDEICVNDKCPKCADYCPVVDSPGVCRYEDRAKPMTNADRIRAMTDEELALFICMRCTECSTSVCPGVELCGPGGKANGLVKWLQQPVKEDAE